jgi:hypothetical protein
MVFNATFNNISVISWWSILLVEETRVPGENHRPAASRCVDEWKMAKQTDVPHVTYKFCHTEHT